MDDAGLTMVLFLGVFVMLGTIMFLIIARSVTIRQEMRMILARERD